MPTAFVINNLVSWCRYKLFLGTKIVGAKRNGRHASIKLTVYQIEMRQPKKFAELKIMGVEDDKYISLMIVNLHKLNVYNKSLGIDLTNQLFAAFHCH